MDLLVDRFDELRYIHLPTVENQFVDALATLDYVIEIPMGVTVRPLLIETRSALSYCCLIEILRIDSCHGRVIRNQQNLFPIFLLLP